MKPKRVILDTNLWISYLISNNFNELDKLIQQQKVILIFSNELLEEFTQVVKRPKFRRFFSLNDVDKLLEMFKQYAELISVSSNIKCCRDPKDDFLLNLSIDGKVDFLITGDKDLLVIEKIKDTQIITFRKFIDNIST